MQNDMIFGENREKILRHKRYRDLAYGGADPIYRVLTLKGDAVLGWYDVEAIEDDGFYHDLGDAVCAMHMNVCDIHDYDRDFGFIVCEFPGIFHTDDRADRIFFVWDDIKEGFYEAAEPEFFKDIDL